MSGPVVVVSGLPGSGKSTLAELLRDATGLPLLSLDTVKEAMVDGLDELGGPEAPGAEGIDRYAIRLAARHVVVALAAANPRGCVVDIWINPHGDESGFADALRAEAGPRFLEVVCRVPVATALDRYVHRERHAAHLPLDDATRQRIVEAAPAIGPLGLGPHLDVDTSAPLGARLGDVLAWLGARGVPQEAR